MSIYTVSLFCSSGPIKAPKCAADFGKFQLNDKAGKTVEVEAESVEKALLAIEGVRGYSNRLYGHGHGSGDMVFWVDSTLTSKRGLLVSYALVTEN